MSVCQLLALVVMLLRFDRVFSDTRISGSLPSFSAMDLNHLIFSNSHISGTLPASLFEHDTGKGKFGYLWGGNTHVSGTVPTAERSCFSSMCIHAPLPAFEICVCCASIMANASLSGTLPASLGCNDELFRELMVGNNSLSGSSSAQFAVWTSMTTLSIEQNPLDWDLHLLSNWTSLERATLQVPAAVRPAVLYAVLVCRAAGLAVQCHEKLYQRASRCYCSPITSFRALFQLRASPAPVCTR